MEPIKGDASTTLHYKLHRNLRAEDTLIDVDAHVVWVITYVSVVGVGTQLGLEGVSSLHHM